MIALYTALAAVAGRAVSTIAVVGDVLKAVGVIVLGILAVLFFFSPEIFLIAACFAE